jgi:hypothetical protein
MIFTPRLSLATAERVEMDINESTPRGRQWQQQVTDKLTGKIWIVAGADCGSGSCFCDAVIVREVV